MTMRMARNAHGSSALAAVAAAAALIAVGHTPTAHADPCDLDGEHEPMHAGREALLIGDPD